MDGNIYQILYQYINQTEANVEDTFNEISSLQCSDKEICSFIWSFHDLSKGMNIFNENAYSRLQELIIYMAQQSEKYKELFFLFLDKADTNQIPGINNMRKSYAIVSRNKYNIEKYQLFYTNPEGFARLLLFFFQKCSNPNDLPFIIGEHKIDPDVILNILFDLVSQDNTNHFIQFLLPFSLQQTLPFVFNGINTEGNDFYYRILSFFLQEKRIHYQNLWKVVGDPDDILPEIYKNYINSIETHCKDLVVVRTILPGETKEDSYPAIYFEHKNECKKYQDELCNSFYFRLLSNSNPFDFNIFDQISQYDPCLYGPISEALSNVLYTKFLENPILFLQTEQYLYYLCTLSCYCTENKLIVGICRYPDLVPPYILSNFILQSLSTNDCGWQLSVPIFNCMMNYPMYLRRQIYKKFSENQNLIGFQKIRVANVTRKIKSIFKRLSIENIDQYTMKVAQLFLACPSVASEKLIDYLFTLSNITSIPYLIIADLSPLSLDYLLLEICERVETPGAISDWPIEMATFLGKTFSEHYDSMDLEGYISFIKIGLKNLKFPYLCLLKSLIIEMGFINYVGNLSKSDIELRTGDNLLSYYVKTKIEDHNEFDFSTMRDHLQKYLLRDQRALDFLTYIEYMHQKNDVKDPDKIDELRYTFILICDFLIQVKITKLTPSELIEQLQFSLPAAIRISHQNYQNLQSLSPDKINSELFGRFWSYNSNDFHIPVDKFEEIDNQFQIRIRQTKDPDFIASLNFVREQLSISLDEQKKRICTIRTEINKKKWFTSHVAYSIYACFVNSCILPRMMFSQEDARYCALFIFSLAHFTDFRINIFNRFFTKKLHFCILAATFNEARCIGLFLMKVLKYCRDRDIESELHSSLIEKFEMIFKHATTYNSEFLIIKTISVLDLISKDFPKTKEHEKSLQTILEEMKSTQSQSICTQIKRYLSNRKIKITKRETKKENLIKIIENEEEEDKSSYYYNYDYDYDYEEEEEYEDYSKRSPEINNRQHFKNLSPSPSHSPSKKLSLSASSSKIDFSDNTKNLNNTSSPNRIKRSQSRPQKISDDEEEYERSHLRRSKSTNNTIDNSTLRTSQSMDSYNFGSNTSSLPNSLTSYYSIPQWNQLLQLQMLSSPQTASSTDLQQQQQQQQQQALLAYMNQISLMQNDQTQNQQQQQQQQLQQQMMRIYLSQLNLLQNEQTHQQQVSLQSYGNQTNLPQTGQNQNQNQQQQQIIQSYLNQLNLNQTVQTQQVQQNQQSTTQSYGNQTNLVQNDQSQSQQQQQQQQSDKSNIDKSNLIQHDQKQQKIQTYSSQPNLVQNDQTQQQIQQILQTYGSQTNLIQNDQSQQQQQQSSTSQYSYSMNPFLSYYYPYK